MEKTREREPKRMFSSKRLTSDSRFQLKKGLLCYRKPFLPFNTLVERPAHCAGLFCERLFLGFFQ
jgi:hypothetical protein